jgi:hypothetical protein
MVMCTMALIQASVMIDSVGYCLDFESNCFTRKELNKLLPACMLSSNLGVFFARQVSVNTYFHCRQTHLQTVTFYQLLLGGGL